MALTALQQFLHLEITCRSATYKTITLTTATVVPSDALKRVRAVSLDLLEHLFRTASNDVERRKVKQALLEATRFPQRGLGNTALQLTVLETSGRVARFFTSVADTLTHELLQTLEQSFLRTYRQARRPADASAEDAPIANARRELIDSIIVFRDGINANREFVVYKTLVGFESVFLPNWDGNGMDLASEESYRKERISALVTDVNSTNADAWLKTLQRCASTRSNDLATFPTFGRFLEELAEMKPEIVETYLDRLGDDLANFLPEMLCGIETTARWPTTKARIDQWISQHRHLPQILRHQRFTDKVDLGIIKQALALAIEDGNDPAVLNAAEICAARSEVIPHEEIGSIFMATIAYLQSKGSTAWVDAVWLHLVKGSLIAALSPEQVDLVLAALVARRSVDDNAEYVLASIAERFPKKVIDFFGERLRQRDEEDVVDHYEAVPYSFTMLGPCLAATGEYVLAQCRALHRENPELSELRSGRFLSVVFPEFTSELEGHLKTILTTEGVGAAPFVVDMLAGYRGAPATHELYKLVVNAVPAEDPLLGSVEVALISTGTVSGEFGIVDAYRRKKAEFQPWLSDSRPRVASYAETHNRMLDRMIAAEQRRSEEQIEARKREYGDDD